MSTPTQPRRAYTAPTLKPMGTLSELTLGGSVNGPSDGHGFAGDMGSLAPSVTRITPGAKRYL